MHERPIRNGAELSAQHYRITINGHLENRWVDWFENLVFAYHDDGTTTLSGPIADPAALRSVLNHISDLGLNLISVQPIEPEA